MNKLMSWLPVETRSERASRINLKFLSLAVILSVCGLSLAGCGGGDISKFGKKYGKASPYYKGNGPVPKGGGRYKVGSPYTVNGKTYYPRKNPGYDKVGKASWYGPTFHGRKTANGEYFDMNRLTGAHPTLPLPSFVRVTNLGNSKSVIIRINDRGPYSHTRVIDVSKKAADVLGFRKRGTARVRVQYVGRAPLNGDDYYTYSASKRPSKQPTRIAAVSATRRSTPQPKATPQFAKHNNDLYVRAASFSNAERAFRLRDNLETLGPVNVVSSSIAGKISYQVRVGPMINNREARRTLRRVVDAGHSSATLIIE